MKINVYIVCGAKRGFSNRRPIRKYLFISIFSIPEYGLAPRVKISHKTTPNDH